MRGADGYIRMIYDGCVECNICPKRIVRMCCVHPNAHSFMQLLAILMSVYMNACVVYFVLFDVVIWVRMCVLIVSVFFSFCLVWCLLFWVGRACCFGGWLTSLVELMSSLIL